ncbi:uncharacterized protein LOC143018581 [Oratosquilla oratoria]|uniref:uncharacterized protein LOC143018581 n=1 Tax=Oratosquilla oratoria TaxID=337810 RepID=UPI003F764F57
MRNNIPSHWKNPEVLGTRATFDAGRSVLTIQRVSREDEGTYRCRVDFQENPTLSYSVNVTVIVPPSSLAVYTSQGLEARGVVGPFLEGDVTRFICRAVGGIPRPQVMWWEDKILLDAQDDPENEDDNDPPTVSNTLMLAPLTRNDLHRTLTCMASNTNTTPPLTTSITIDMNFPPLWVKLLTAREPLRAGRTYELVCQAVGSRPQAVIFWKLDHVTLHNAKHRTTDEGNVTISTLMWSPNAQDAGSRLTCLAKSPALNMAPLHDHWDVDVFYIPEVSLSPGKSLNLSDIEEGDDVYFECSIKSNPKVYKIVWLHQSRELVHNVSSGVIISNQSLVLQRVSRASSGEYHCVASNVEGDGKSNPIHLRVKYTPVCRSDQVLYHGAARHEQVNIPCILDAHPVAVSFRWTFNNSGESVDIPQDHIIAEGSRSSVSYTPMTELDYGTLLCWGTNAVGIQKNPCVFHVFPAGRPDPVHNCSAYNLSVDVVNVRCSAGFDGGLAQTFILELYEPNGSKLLANVSNQTPVFSVPDMPPGMTVNAVVYPYNGKGRGGMVSFNAYTLKDVAERRTAAVKPPPPNASPTSVSFSITPVLAVVFGGAAGLLVVVIIILAVVRLRHDNRLRGRRNNARGSGAGGGAGGGGGGDGGGEGTGPRTTDGNTTGVVVGDKEEIEEDDDDNVVLHSKAAQLMDETLLVSKDSIEKNPDIIKQCHALLSSGCFHHEGDAWAGDGVKTISSSSLANTYTTLPRTAHLYHQYPYPSEVQYAELALPRRNSGPSNGAGVRHQDSIVYATLDHHHRPHAHTTTHLGYTQVNTTPPPPPATAMSATGPHVAFSADAAAISTPSPPRSAGAKGQSQQMYPSPLHQPRLGAPYAKTPHVTQGPHSHILPRRASLRQKTTGPQQSQPQPQTPKAQEQIAQPQKHLEDAEMRVPLIAKQKESSV